MNENGRAFQAGSNMGTEMRTHGERLVTPGALPFPLPPPWSGHSISRLLNAHYVPSTVGGQRVAGTTQGLFPVGSQTPARQNY